MKASAKNLLTIIKEPKQFIIPIYQRTYSWQEEQCKVLLKDIQKASVSDYGHFVGSIVYFQPDIHTIADINQFLVIDGQQRLTTITLLIAALVRFIETNPDCEVDTTAKKLKNYYLFNAEEEGDLFFKLLLTRRDKATLINLLTDKPRVEHGSERVIENYTYFLSKITKSNVNTIYNGLQRLIVVDVALERGKDNPQLIFESLNSTGLNLSQADLIRNYLLMGQSAKEQKRLYETYWYPMEQSFGEHLNYLPLFVRDYLTMKLSDIPKISEVYNTFKAYYSNQGQNIEAVIKELYTYSVYYVFMTLHKGSDEDLKAIFQEISKQRMDTAYPFLLAVYNDFENDIITKEEFVDILHITKNYVFRRGICGIPTNSLNKTFSNLYKNVKRETYLDSVKAAYLLLDRFRRFPNDIEFLREIKVKDVYNFRMRNYLLESLENYNRKEPIRLTNYTVEHVLPQNPNISEEWKSELGEHWKLIQDQYLHTLGNLTLTAYNSELSDKPFNDKKQLEGGFNDSPLYLNKSVRAAEVWNRESIMKRADVLAERALKIWRRPALPEDVFREYVVPETLENGQYSLEHYKHLQNDILDVFNALKIRLTALDDSIHIEYRKQYIAFKSQTNFVDVVPQKRKLRLFINIDFDKIDDPKRICRDVTKIGSWGNGNVEVSLEHNTQIDDVVYLIKQAYDLQCVKS